MLAGLLQLEVLGVISRFDPEMIEEALGFAAFQEICWCPSNISTGFLLSDCGRTVSFDRNYFSEQPVHSIRLHQFMFWCAGAHYIP